ncbi:hypothetical protein MPL1032_130059 [Mesorhizobium plurifarium]|uniref:Uncharacterized protein n=1 Tax=Mesorhizobium plurifarium TaxID=69974 RepID=A0A0K2VQ78_MESPL|nr:hypothetical protein MPL1032_130059 [Mesorhizobium plurifarium]
MCKSGRGTMGLIVRLNEMCN